MKRWKLISIIMVLIIPIVFGLDMCEDSILINTNCTMLTPALNCTIINYEIINLSGDVLVAENLTLLKNDIYQFNITLGEGEYIARLCDGSTREFKIEEEEDKMIIAIIILLPMILSIMFLIGAAILDQKEHKTLKIFLFLLSPLPFFVSMNIAIMSVVKFYDFPELQNLIGSTTYWFGWVFFVIIVYFIIYLFYTVVNHISQKKQERLKF